ncbi:hypothetical protein AJ87_04220 [Rhizobium yanglingense]|nr:hypothetical protein AJ87_04220 [Rhizobium yanglingense]
MLAAGILQLAVVYVGVLHAGMSIGFRFPRMTPNVKRLLILAVPAAVTGGITQINQLIGQAIASSRDGAIAALQYADRIYQLPLGVVGVAVGVVLLPELARALKGGNLREAGNLQNRSIEFVLFLTIPAAFALWVLADEIIRVLYERGAFDQRTQHLSARSSRSTASASRPSCSSRRCSRAFTPARIPRRRCAFQPLLSASTAPRL